MDNQDENIVEGETVEEESNVSTDSSSSSTDNAAMDSTSFDNTQDKSSPQAVSLSLESLIKGHISTLTRLKSEIAEHNNTLNNILDNDPTYKQHAEEAKKATKTKTATKAEIMKRPEVMQVAQKIKAGREEYKDQSQTLSELLAEYQRTTGLDSIETEDGKVRKIVTTAKLVS